MKEYLQGEADVLGTLQTDVTTGLSQAEAAELLVAGKGWLPPLLRTAGLETPEATESGEQDADASGTPSRSDEEYPFAAE